MTPYDTGHPAVHVPGVHELPPGLSHQLEFEIGYGKYPFGLDGTGGSSHRHDDDYDDDLLNDFSSSRSKFIEDVDSGRIPPGVVKASDSIAHQPHQLWAKPGTRSSWSHPLPQQPSYLQHQQAQQTQRLRPRQSRRHWQDQQLSQQQSDHADVERLARAALVQESFGEEMARRRARWIEREAMRRIPIIVGTYRRVADIGYGKIGKGEACPPIRDAWSAGLDADDDDYDYDL